MRSIVTGAASGIGSAIARLLARETGADIVVTDRDSRKLGAITQELRRMGARVDQVVGDIADVSLPSVLVDRCVERFGGVDAIVSNAGAVTGAPLLELDVERSFALCPTRGRGETSRGASRECANAGRIDRRAPRVSRADQSVIAA